MFDLPDDKSAASVEAADFGAGSATDFASVDTLSQEALLALSNSEIHAIRVKRFYPAALCSRIARRMLNNRLFGKYENAPLIGRVGQALYESQASDEARHKYWKNAQAWTRELREACAPVLTPIDRLRLELDETWSAGASQGLIDGQRAFVGLARVFNEGSNAEPHQDVLAWDVPGSRTAQSLSAQLAANIYLRMSPRGGELTLWDVELTQSQYKRIQNPGSYGVDASQLPAPIVRLSPEVGELIVFNSRRVHAVEEPKGGPRVTWSSFIGVRDTSQPLMVWS